MTFAIHQNAVEMPLNSKKALKQYMVPKPFYTYNMNIFYKLPFVQVLYFQLHISVFDHALLSHEF